MLLRKGPSLQKTKKHINNQGIQKNEQVGGEKMMSSPSEVWQNKELEVSMEQFDMLDSSQILSAFKLGV